ncbi:MAG: LTA synthase family protein [Bacteroidales bacterium]|nr:LTA synthase family protein [Bacteroidales bacterium]MCF8404646.1 LTA synthase family protein [Bacteroidales bacterium]
MMVNYVDVIYIRFTQKRMTFGIFDFIRENKTEINALLPDFIADYWVSFGTWILSILLLIFAVNKVNALAVSKRPYLLSSYRNDAVKLIVGLVLIVLSIRGGFQRKPIDFINAGDYTQPKFFPIILNTPFTILKSLDRAEIEEKNYFKSLEDLESVYSPVLIYSRENDAINRSNIVLIIVESLTTEHVGYLNSSLENGNYIGFTPFLDSLFKKSLVFRGFANGVTSMDGIPATISGIPSMMDRPFLISPYATNKINSIPEVLKGLGYYSAFFHGGTNGTMGFDSYCKIAGFDDYFGREEYGNDNDFDGNWGIFDEPFLQYAVQKLNQIKKPFFATLYTLSSHHPFTIPEQYKDKFAKGPSEISESIGYTDYALKRFFANASKQTWFDNTLFIITADHTFRGYHPFYRRAVGKYSIPIAFYKKDMDHIGIGNRVVQQTDIFPSILDYIGYQGKTISFGNSIYDTNRKRYAISYHAGIFQTIKEDYVYQFDGEKSLALYNYKMDSILKNNLLEKEPILVQEYEIMTKAVIQQFYHRLINNKLVSD